MPTPVRIAWRLETPRDIEATWEAFADTDRFNLVAQLGLRFAEEARPDGTTQRTGFVRTLGMNISWDEEPFAYRRPHWFRSVRRFHGGPAESITTELSLQPREGGGTQIDYAITGVARNVASRVLVSLDLNRRMRPLLDKALASLTESLAAAPDVRDFGWRPPALSSHADALLDRARNDPTVEPKVFDALESFLRTAPLREQARISPLHLTELFHLDMDDVITTLLSCVDLGVLSVRLDITCPYCRGAQPIPNEGGDAHCPSCNVRFDRSFPNSVVVHFEPTSLVRPQRAHVECLGSPARQPHVIGQDVVAPSQECDFEIDLPPGVYQLRTLPPHGPPVSVMAYETVPPDHPTVVVAQHRTTPRTLRVRPGAVRLGIHNACTTPARLMFCRQKQHNKLLTAGVLWEEFPESHDYFPKRYFKSTTSRYGCVVALYDPDDPRGTVLASAATDAVSWFEAQAGCIAVFESRAQALTCISRLPQLSSQWVGYGEGPVLHVDMGQGAVPMGRAVDQAVGAMHGAGPGSVAMPRTWADGDDVKSALAEVGLASETSPFPGAGGITVVWLTRSR